MTAPLDLTHPALQPQGALALERLQALRDSYIRQGRGREAHAVGRSMTLLWHTLVHPGQAAPAPDSNFTPMQPEKER